MIHLLIAHFIFEAFPRLIMNLFVAEDDLEPLILLPSLPQGWTYRYVPSHPVLCCAGDLAKDNQCARASTASN